MNRRNFLKTLAAGAAAIVVPIPEPVKRPVRRIAQRFGLMSAQPSYFGIEPICIRVEAGEAIGEGDVVYLGADGKAYREGNKPIGVYAGNGLVMINGISTVLKND